MFCFQECFNIILTTQCGVQNWNLTRVMFYLVIHWTVSAKTMLYQDWRVLLAKKCLQNFLLFFSVLKHEMFKVDFYISSPSSLPPPSPLLCALLHPCSQSCLTKPTKQRMWQKHDPSLLRYHLHSSFFNIVTPTFSILHWHILNSFL